MAAERFAEMHHEHRENLFSQACSTRKLTVSAVYNATATSPVVMCRAFLLILIKLPLTSAAGAYHSGELQR